MFSYVMHNTCSMVLLTRPGREGYIITVGGPTDHQHDQDMQGKITRKQSFIYYVMFTTYDIK